MRVLMRCVLDDPNTQQNGRQGQPQHGVDVYGYRNKDVDALVGVQCKKKFEKPVTESELETELEKALKFEPGISEFILTTTAPRDQAIQTKARLLTKKLNDDGRAITVAVWGWQDIHAHAAEHLAAWKAFDPTFSPYVEQQHIETLTVLEGHGASLDRIEKQLEQLASLQTAQSSAALVQVDKGDRDDTEIFGFIKAYERLIDDGNAKLGLESLERLKDDKWAVASEAERYRLLACMGKAQLQLGKEDAAGDLLLRAVDAFPQHPRATLTKAKGHFLLGDRPAALTVAEKLLTDEKLGAEAAGIVIQCRYESGLADHALDGVGEALLAETIVVSSLIVHGGEKVGQWSGSAVLLRGGVKVGHWLG